MVARSAADSLRVWARGSYADEAAVELLARAFDGRFAVEGVPWVRPTGRPGCSYLDPDAIDTYSGGLSGAERRVLAVVAALTGDRPLHDLSGILVGVDRPNLGLILAALAHAGGSHQQADLILTPENRVEFVELPALIDWAAPRASIPSHGMRAAS
ncbi:hypothetical protein FHX74_001636 [Friedmanniella endophytica]|uniref:Uncharacterized protein n=1 Tax=Microlunatus kandeliicorticis TaxID=1759536 RepID=A0A7W3IRR4_9ACTN|nr:hypothetical protein [Microlunatus kandeliicorticis]MBA8794031.1 hypothetical protein [Microlunatus kandeliicorticis]